MSRVKLVLRAEVYVVLVTLGQFVGFFQQVRNPTVEVGWLRRVGLALLMTLTAPILLLVGLFAIPTKLLLQRAARTQVVRSDNTSA